MKTHPLKVYERYERITQRRINMVVMICLPLSLLCILASWYMLYPEVIDGLEKSFDAYLTSTNQYILLICLGMIFGAWFSFWALNRTKQ